MPLPTLNTRGSLEESCLFGAGCSCPRRQDTAVRTTAAYKADFIFQCMKNGSLSTDEGRCNACTYQEAMSGRESHLDDHEAR